MRLEHVGWVTNNVSKFEYFWCTGLGFKKVWQATIHPDKVKQLFNIQNQTTAIRYQKDDIIIEIHAFDPPIPEVCPAFNVFGINHIGIWVKDREGFIDELVKRIGYVEIKRFYDNSGWWNIFIRDYDGNWIEVRTDL